MQAFLIFIAPPLLVIAGITAVFWWGGKRPVRPTEPSNTKRTGS